jgi:hypothetical protein
MYAPDPRLVNKSEIRRRCRHCGEDIGRQIRNDRDRFCCQKCADSFYRIRCRVCERPISLKNSRRQLCGRPKCASAFRRDKGRFFGTRYPYAGLSEKRGKTSTISRAKIDQNGGSRIAQIAGPTLSEAAFRFATIPPDPELVARHARDRAALVAERDRRLPPPLIGPFDPPANVVGGYRFPGAPKITITPATSSARRARRRNFKLPPIFRSPTF